MKNQEKLFLIILMISVLLNIRQCSDSKDFDYEKLVREYELSEMDGDLADIKSEITKLSNLLTKNQSTITPVKIEVKKPVSIKRTTIKTIDSVDIAPVSDTTKIN